MESPVINWMTRIVCIITAFGVIGCKNRKRDGARTRSADNAVSESTDPGTGNFVNLNEEFLPESPRSGLVTIESQAVFDLLFPAQVATNVFSPYTVEQRLNIFGLPGSPSHSRRSSKVKNTPLPLGWSEVEIAGKYYQTSNCFFCHAGVVGNQTIGGAYNRHVNFASFAEAFEKSNSFFSGLSSYLFSMDQREKTAVDHATHYGRVSKLTNRTFRTVGDNLTQYLSWTYAAFLKPNAANFDDTFAPGEKVDAVEQLLNKSLVPVQANPWWTMKYKSNHYWYGDSTDDLDQAAHDFTMNFSLPHSANSRNFPYSQRVITIRKVLAYAYSTISPRYPEPLDPQRVEQGRRLFHGIDTLKSGSTAACSSCHGSYTPVADGDYSRWLVDYPRDGGLHDVGLDPSYNNLLRKISDLTKVVTEVGQRTGAHQVPRVAVPQIPGYIAPPLDGVWASAPYFHNGSVPTLWDVLKPSQRPEIWQINENPRAYNFKQVGIDYQPIDRAVVESATKSYQNHPSEIERPALIYRRIYDTRDPYKSNSGHNFGEALNDDERTAVIEFLKALSGPGVRPKK